MAGVVIEFLRRFFDAHEVVIEDLTVELSAAGLSETSYAELDEGLTLLAGEVSPEQQQLVEASRAQLASAVTGQPGAVADLTMAEVHIRLGQMGVVPVDAPGDGDLPPGITFGSAPADAAAQVADDAGPGATGTDASSSAGASSPAPASAESSASSEGSSSGSGGSSSGAGTSQDSGPGHYPPGHNDHHPPPVHDDHYPPPHHDDDGHQPPPTNGEHHDDDYPPPPNGEYPDYWAGYEVRYHDSGYPIVQIGDIQVRLLPDGEGGYYAAHGAYRLGEADGGGLEWDPPGALVLRVSHLTETGLVVPVGSAVTVTFEPDYITWETADNGPLPVQFDTSTYTFLGLDTGTGELSMLHDEYGYYHVLSLDGTPRFIDPATGDMYESAQDYLEAHGYDPDQNGDVDPDDDIDTIDDVPDGYDWAGYPIETDDDGYYVEIDGVQLRLEPNGAGGYHVDHGEYRLVEIDGALAWTNPPYGYTYPVAEVTATGIVLPITAGVEVRVAPNQTTWVYHTGSGESSVTFGAEWGFYGIEDGELVMRHAEQGFDYLVGPDGGGRYRLPETGEYYDSYSELQEALDEYADGTVDPDNGDPDQNGDGPDDWAGYDTQYRDDGYYYIEVDGVELRLEPNGAGGYHVDHGQYRLVEIDGAMVWTNPPYGYTYAVAEVTATGIVLPVAADVEVRIEPNQVVWERDTGGGSSSITFGGQDWTFRGIENGEVAMRHSGQGFEYLVAPDGSARYRDPDTGEYYDSYSDLQEALTDNADDGMVDPGDTDDDQDNGDIDQVDAEPLTWGGAEVEADAQGDYVEINGVQLRLMPDGAGGYYADRYGYRLDADAAGPIEWTAPDGVAYEVELTDQGFEVDHPDGIGTLGVHQTGFVYNSTSGSVGLGQEYEFHGFIDGGIVISATEVHPFLRLEFADGNLSWVNTQTGEHYDTFPAFEDGLDDVPTEQEENINDDDPVDQVDDSPGTWGGYELENDSGTYSVTVDGVPLELTPAGNGQYYAEHHGHQLHEAAAGGLVWRGAPDGNDYAVDRVWSNGFQIDHPAGGHTWFYDGHFDVQYPGGGSVSLYEPFGFYGFSGDGVVATGYQIHPDMHVVVENGNVTYVDRVSGETYESQSAFIEAHEQEAETIDVGSVFTDGELGQSDGGPADNGEAEADKEPEPLEPTPPPPPPDSIGIDYAGGQPVLSMVYGGTPYQVPLSAQNGGYYVNVGGQAYEVHQEGGTYFIVADGNAYDLHGNPEIMGWPVNNPAYGIDVSPYVDTPEPAETSNGQSPGDSGMDTPPPDSDDQSGDQDGTDDGEPDDDGYTFYGRYNDDGTMADGMGGDGDDGLGGTGGMDDQPPLEESLPPSGMGQDGAEEMLAETGPPEEQATE